MADHDLTTLEGQLARLDEIVDGLRETLGEKRPAYRDNLRITGALMALVWRRGIPRRGMNDAFVMARIFDKFIRIASMHYAIEDGQPFKEQENPWHDVAGYGVAVQLDQEVDQVDPL